MQHLALKAGIAARASLRFQLEGKASDVFETPDDLTINGDLIYLYTGYGAVFQVNVAGLTKAIDETLND